MTQKRKLDMRAEKERHLREVIASCKEHLQNFKIARSTNLGGKGWLGEQIRKRKTILTACKHELQRIKGMDRVVIPSEQYDRRFETYNWYCTKCDSEISVFENYCSECGRRILWEKVK